MFVVMNVVKRAYVYGLIDPRDHAIFYVGTAFNPEARLKQHIFSSSEKVNKRFRTIKKYGGTVNFVILGSHINRKSAEKIERDFIKCTSNLENIYPIVRKASQSFYAISVLPKDKALVARAAKKTGQSIAAFLREAVVGNAKAILGAK